MNTNDDNKDGTHIANMCISLLEQLMLGYTTQFDRNLHKWISAILMDEERRRQQERYLDPVGGETWESIKSALDELAKPNKNSYTITTDSVNYPSHVKTYHIWDVKAPDHNISIDEVCNMLVNNALCNKYWSDNNDKPSKRR